MSPPNPDENRPLEEGGEQVFKTGQITVENKTFTFALKENRRGRFLQIIETDGHRAKIIIPASGIQEFTWMIEALIRSISEPPPAET